jgi:uncharacterized protein (DUF2147 family)
MRIVSYAIAALTLSAVPAVAADPVGDWLVNDKVATIRIENCSGRLWGVVSWEKEPGGVDSNNPDPAKRRRPTLGMPVLLGMQPTGANQWEGKVYNSRDGKTYPVTLAMTSPNVLRIEGCLLGFLCGGENWTRVQSREAAPKSICGSISADASRVTTPPPVQPRR